jgi:hypothetical protein
MLQEASFMMFIVQATNCGITYDHQLWSLIRFILQVTSLVGVLTCVDGVTTLSMMTLSIMG